MIEMLDQPHGCEHCKRKFSNPRTLLSHMCERKRRALQKDEKRVQAGFMAFNQWWKLAQGAKKNKTYDEFVDSSYYNAFVKFGSFLNNVNPIYPEKFVDFVIKSGVKLDHWCRDELYERYLYDMIKVEPVESAVQRSIQTMMEWGDQHNTHYSHYFNDVSLSKAVYDIKNGTISPWVILNTKMGYQMINNMSDEQLVMIGSAFDILYWQKRFKELPGDVALVKEICKEIGVE